jgi:hypothetical protein
MGRRIKCAYCGSEVKEDVVKIKSNVATKTGINCLSRNLHKECYNKIRAMSQEDTWDKIYRTMQSLLGLEDDVLLDSHAVNRLLGLEVGRMLPNNEHYSNTIVCNPCTLEEILIGMENVDSHALEEYFADNYVEDNKHKTNVVMKFIVYEIRNLSELTEDDVVVRFPRKTLA